MKVFSASRREDMPAFHFNELMARYQKEGKDTFWVLWTKDPHKLIGAGLDWGRVALQMTVTGLGATQWERNVPGTKDVIADLKILIGEGLNPDLVNWRFDPVIRANCPESAAIERIAPEMSALGITRCVTSFVTFYGVVKSRWPDWQESEFSESEQRQIALHMKSVLKRHGIDLYGCVQPHLADLIQPSSCVDGGYYSAVTGFDLADKKDVHQRKDCHCTVSQDIGKYRHCQHGCVYCYSRGNYYDNGSEILIDDM